jgi:putative DNA primase/helicase
VATLREIDADAAAVILGYAPKCRGSLLKGRLIVVPVEQANGVSTLELIDGEGHKVALAGRGTKAGGFWACQRLPERIEEGQTFLIAEGVATALSASQATGYPAIAALSAGNLPAVAKRIREGYPAALVILADLIKATGKPDRHAIQAAESVHGKLAIPAFGLDRDPCMTDFNDMMILNGAEAVALAITNATEPAQSQRRLGDYWGSVDDSVGHRWPDPQPLAAKVEPEPYPLAALPLPIRAAVQEVAGFVKAPIPMVASSALAALSLAIQAHTDVKRLDHLDGPVGLFILVIADSGERKSTCDGFFMKSINDYEAAQAEAAKPALKDHRAAHEAWEAKRGGIKDKIRQLAKVQKSTTTLESVLRDLEHAKPETPRLPRLLYADATPEALAYGLAKQWPSGGVICAEAGIVLGSHGMGTEAVMRNLSLLNQLWDGKGPTIDRRSTESFTVRGARLTVALQVQESTLREFLTRSGVLARGTGFLARFLTAWPESTQGMRQINPDAPDGPTTWPHLAAFHQRIAVILGKPVPMNEGGALNPPMLPLTPEAKKAWVDYHNAIESELLRGGALYDVRDVASKSADNAARLAALFQRFEDGGGAIGLEAFESARLIAAWHLHESRRFFGELALPAELTDAARLDGWLVEYCRRQQTVLVSTREAQRLGPIRDKPKLFAALQVLTELDRVILTQDGQRKTIKVHPVLVGDVL